MTKKDYELIAGVLYCKTEDDERDLATNQTIILELADALQEDNPKFDRNKFLQACGIETSKTLRAYKVKDGQLVKD